jgi:limonene-1,2-epoxide hydrolase
MSDRADSPTTTVTAFLAALEELDIDRALTYAAPDIVYQNVPLPPARGVAAFEKQLRTMARYGTGFQARLHNIAADGPVVLTERTDVLEAGGWRAAFPAPSKCGTAASSCGATTSTGPRSSAPACAGCQGRSGPP